MDKLLGRGDLLLTLLPVFGREFAVEPTEDEICRVGRLLELLERLVLDGRFELTLLRELDGRLLLPPDLFTFERLLFVPIWIPPYIYIS